jgi:Protein kinase domain
MQPEPDDTPTEIGRFHILWELARGGMGVVYRAFDPILNRIVAIKVIQSRFATDTGTKLRFLEESQITAKLQHPGVPPVYDGGELPDGRPYLAMKLIKGHTLAHQLKEREKLIDQRGRFLQLFESIAQTVGFAHANGVIHRDLKPAKIMVGAYGEVQVMDWGLARSAEREEQKNSSTSGQPGAIFETMEGSMLGTPAYAAPEQARGELDKVDERADVFGLGGLLCMILAGVPPFLGTDVKSTLALAIVGDTTEAMDNLTRCEAEPELIELCTKCLAKEPEDRPANGQAVAEAIAAYRTNAEARTQAALVERAKAETEAIAQRKRQRLLIGALSILSVLVVLAVWQGIRATVARDDARTAQGKTKLALKDTAEALDAATEARKKMFFSVRSIHAEYANEMSERPRSSFIDGKKFYTTRQTYDLKTLLPLWVSFQETKPAEGRRSAMAIEAELRIAALENDLGLGDQAFQRYKDIEKELCLLVQEEPTFDNRLLLAYWHRGLADLYDQKFDYAQSISYYAQAAYQAEELFYLDRGSLAADRLTVLCLWDMAMIAEKGVSYGHPAPNGAESPTDTALAAEAYAKLMNFVVASMPQAELRDGSSEIRSAVSIRQRVGVHALDGLLRCWRTTPAKWTQRTQLETLYDASEGWKRGGHTHYELLVRSKFEWLKRMSDMDAAQRIKGYQELLDLLASPDAKASRNYIVQTPTELSVMVLLELLRDRGRMKDHLRLASYETAYAKALDRQSREVVPTAELWIKNTQADLQIHLTAFLERFESMKPADIEANLQRIQDWMAKFKKMQPAEKWTIEWGLVKELEARFAKSKGDVLAVRKALDEWQANGLPTEVLIDHLRWHGWLLAQLEKTTGLDNATITDIRKDSLARTTFMIGLIAKHDPLSLGKIGNDSAIAPLRADAGFKKELDKYLRSPTAGHQPSQR